LVTLGGEADECPRPLASLGSIVMPSPFGRISWPSVTLILLILAVIVTGLVLPGRTGNLVAAGGLIAFGVVVLLEVGFSWSAQESRRRGRGTRR